MNCTTPGYRTFTQFTPFSLSNPLLSLVLHDFFILFCVQLTACKIQRVNFMKNALKKHNSFKVGSISSFELNNIHVAH